MDDSTPISEADETSEFYLPGTFQFGHGPGRLERFLGRVFRDRREAERPVVDSLAPEFYLPGTPDVRPSKSR